MFTDCIANRLFRSLFLRVFYVGPHFPGGSDLHHLGQIGSNEDEEERVVQ